MPATGRDAVAAVVSLAVARGHGGAARNTLTTIVRAAPGAADPADGAAGAGARAHPRAGAVARHAQPLRSDVLDGLLDALVDSALDEPPPWTARAAGACHRCAVACGAARWPATAAANWRQARAAAAGRRSWRCCRA
jgi:hypothetical protein